MAETESVTLWGLKSESALSSERGDTGAGLDRVEAPRARDTHGPSYGRSHVGAQVRRRGDGKWTADNSHGKSYSGGKQKAGHRSWRAQCGCEKRELGQRVGPAAAAPWPQPGTARAAPS